MQSIHPSWNDLFDQYDINLDSFYNYYLPILPPKEFTFRVFEMAVEDIRVVLLGQDPYHGVGQAHGLSFSVPKGVSIPPSLKNIYKELKQSFPERNYSFSTGDLTPWFQREKIFLMNSAFTVIESCPGSHVEYWKEFTDNVIKYIDEKNKHCVFLLLGNFAKAKESLITNKQKIIMEVHPSPLAKGFIGSKVFQRVEEILGEKIDWSLE